MGMQREAQENGDYHRARDGKRQLVEQQSTALATIGAKRLS